MAISRLEDVALPQSDDTSLESDLFCAICFETKSFVSLPCACNVNYCATCWDRALALSVAERGHAQCPSCRMAFLIDFVAETGSLVFSKQEKGTSQRHWRSRLYGKAKPVQIRLLKNYGSAVQYDAVVPKECTEDHSLMCTSKSPEAESQFANKPLCVCGASLERVSSKARIMRMLEYIEADWRSRVSEADQLVDSLVRSSLITCDLCDRVATRTGSLWTCVNGPHTVLHPEAYEVCESCFSKYAGASSQRKSTGGSRSDGNDGWCQACPFAMINVLAKRWQQKGSANGLTSTAGAAASAAVAFASAAGPTAAGARAPTSVPQWWKALWSGCSARR